jgi:hypothetical protein
MSEQTSYIVQQKSHRDIWIDIMPTYPISDYADPKEAAMSHLLDARLDNVSDNIKFRLILREITEKVIA